MSSRARYDILQKPDDQGRGPWILSDIGPWDKYPPITSDVEYVVDDLYCIHGLRNGERVFYFDSERNLDEILHENGKFKGFKPGPWSSTPEPME